MRSLEEWTKYLERQEQALEQTAQPRLDTEIPRTIERSSRPIAAEQLQTVVVSEPEKLSVAIRAHEPPTAQVVTTGDSAVSPIAVPDDAIVKTASRLRKRIPGKLMSEAAKADEVAQNSYSVFKETREELLQRLLDPQLTLEDTARILNVCPTTVRRYTNRGLLKHVRTAGNQRRFRLSDVLSFMESHMGSVPEIDD